MLQICVFLLCLGVVSAFIGQSRLTSRPKVGRLYENFGFDFAEDQAESAPLELFGEANYKKFVELDDPDALLLGGPKYNILERVRELKLLSATADSGLLEVLEAKGLTLSQVEKLLPLADQLNLLPLAVSNKELILSLAPLIIEPAPALIPVVVSLLKNPALVTLPGAVLGAAGAYELVEGHPIIGALALLPALPLLAVGSILGSSISVPTVTASSAPMTVSSVTNAETAGPSIKIGPAPTVASKGTGGSNNGKRKVVRINT